MIFLQNIFKKSVKKFGNLKFFSYIYYVNELIINVKTMSKKVKISIDGTEFLIPHRFCKLRFLQQQRTLYLHEAKVSCSIIKQYVKKTYPSLKV